MNLLELFDPSLRLRPGEAALEWEGVTRTFGEIEERSNRLAHVLHRRGVAAGDRVCVQLANCIEVIDLYLACVKLGAIFVPVNVLYRDREVRTIVSDAEPALFVSRENLAELNRAREAESDERPAVPTDEHSVAAIVYTSGTTGSPKGAMLTHGSFIANARTLLEAWRITASDRLFLSLPLFHVHGLGNGLHCWLASGCRTRLLERFDHRTAAAELLDFRPTLFFGVPTMYTRLLEIDRRSARAIGASMRLFVSGSAPLPADVFARFREHFGHTILERYGMTETLMTLSNPYDGERRPGTVGMPLPGVEVRIEQGELLVRSPSLFAGYWKRGAARTNDGWFRTGDLAEVSDDGYYTLLGRRSDLIISGGFNIYPREIEELLLEQPGVREAAVVGAPDPLRGEVPVAFVAGEAGPADLERACRENLASFKVPRRFIFVESLPRNALGKVQKHLLGV
ncbi:MAG TPA: AMP-binding protein [Thermoanaerobaculia bacterium]|nr:AMP-binding protein [Thermoanaerobaculia bacterium]